ncbi:ATP--guanido phosphotransferase [Bacillota bacterium Meth-B3]
MTDYLAPEQDVVLSSRVRLARNYADIPFFPKMDGERAGLTIERARAAMERKPGDYEFLRMAELSEDARNRLVERHLVSYDLLKFKQWSAALISSGETTSIMVNEEDHLRIQGLLPGLQLERAAELAFKADDRLSEQGRFAYDAQWGYLTSCPTNVGTGMRASTMLHLPALSATGQIGSIVQAVAKLSMTVRGIYGEGSDAVGCLYQVSNQSTLGRTEDDIIRALIATTLQLAGHERQVREAMNQQDAVAVADKLMRSVGILKTARMMSAAELMPRMSDLRVAASIGLVNFPVNAVDALVWDLQNGSLAVRAGEALSERARDALRADILRDALKVI